MPHLQLQYSDNLHKSIDMAQLCDQLNEIMCASPIFPIGGVRVRAFAASAFSIADRHPQNAFIDMVLRIGSGRSAEEKQAIGQALIDQVSQTCAALLQEPHFALSLEIIDISPAFSWKVNSIHPRLKQQSS